MENRPDANKTSPPPNPHPEIIVSGNLSAGINKPAADPLPDLKAAIPESVPKGPPKQPEEIAKKNEPPPERKSEDVIDSFMMPAEDGDHIPDEMVEPAKAETGIPAKVETAVVPEGPAQEKRQENAEPERKSEQAGPMPSEIVEKKAEVEKQAPVHAIEIIEAKPDCNDKPNDNLTVAPPVERRIEVKISEASEIPEVPDNNNAALPADGEGIKLELPEDADEELEKPESAQRVDTLAGMTPFSSDTANGLSCEKLKYVVNRSHPRVIDSGEFLQYPMCADTGSHPCVCTSRGESSFKKFGIGIVLYFKRVKYLAVLTFILSLLAIPALVLYCISNPYDTNSIALYSINRKALAKTTFGNLGRGGYACTSGQLNAEVFLKCMYGTLESIQNFGYETGASTCSTEDAGLTVDSGCSSQSMGTSSAVTATFTTLCKGKNSCAFNVSSTYVSSACASKFPSGYIFMNALCESTQVEVSVFSKDFSINKSDIALITVICDVAATLIFAGGIALLGYYERQEVRELKKKAQYVSDYSVEINYLYKFGYTDILGLKQALWTHIEKVLEKENGGQQEWKVFDIQIAQSDTHFVDLLQTLQTEQRALKLMEKRSKKAESSDVGVEKQKARVQAAEQAIEEYKNTRQQPYMIKAFVTFSSIQAARAVHEAYDFNCCSRCCYAENRYNHRLLDKKWLDVSHTTAPTDIKWRNLQVGPCQQWTRKLLTALLSLIIIAICAAIMVIGKEYESTLMSDYPDRPCPNYSITAAMAEKDYYRGKDKWLGLLPCYCVNRIKESGLGIVSEEFPVQHESLCKNWVLSYGKSNGLMLGTVLFVSVANICFYYVLTMITALERSHSVTSELASGTFKIFLSQFINSAIVIFLVNLKTDADLDDHFPILKGNYSEFSVKWYEVVGTTIILFTLVMAASSQFMEFLKFLWTVLRRFCDRRCSSDMKQTKQLIQEDYESVYTGPEFDLQVRYANELNLIFVSLFYSSGMPLLTFCLPFFFLVTYIVDKCLFLRFFKRPPQYDSNLSDLSQSLYKFAILLHLAIGFWMFSNGEIVQYSDDFSNVKTLQGGIKNYSSLPIADRASSVHSMIMLIAFLFMVCVYVVGYILSRLFCCRGQDQTVETTDLLELLSYEDAMNEYLETRLELGAAEPMYPQLAGRLRDKLERIGNVLCRFLEQGGCMEGKSLGPTRLTREVLYRFFYANRGKLVKGRLDGLYTYKMMSNPKYVVFKEQWEGLHESARRAIA